jgi:TM2 domain-containing membrane protein YozV/uncharacterized tellurite resistance protein B-like protein
MKNKNTATILSFFLGGFGIHRFYLGQITLGILYILFFWTFIPLIIAVLDTILFFNMTQEKFDSKYNRKYTIPKRAISSIEITDRVIKNRPLPSKNNDKIYLPKADILEKSELIKNSESIKLNSLAHINYTDASGQKSERRITLHSICSTYGNDYMIQAYCHEREAERSFKLSRISQITDMETGEFFTNPQKYFLDRFQDTPIGKITKCFQKLESEILVLTFISRADGFLRKKERQIIMNFILNNYEYELDNNILEDEIRKTYCESSEFRKSLKKIKEFPILKREEIFKLSIDIVNTDKSPDPMELGAIELIRQELEIKI